MLRHMIANWDIFICPICGGSFDATASSEMQMQCLQCKHFYEIDGGIPLLFYSNEWDHSKKDVTRAVKSFYEKTPFPNYEDFEKTGDLVRKAQAGLYARLLNEQVPFNIRVLEVGCGTGQLSNFLGISNRSVFGTDMCVPSLKLAQDFKVKNNLERVEFYQMNLFRPIFREESFSLVICNGVLHHTSDPFLGFKSISGLVKKGGYIIVGLYNKYGRIVTDIRRMIFKIFGNRFQFLDTRLRENINDVRKQAWFEDQYKNPHESKHTIGEVLKWFDQTGFDFCNGIPKPKAFSVFSENEKLFKPASRGDWFDHFLVQASLICAGEREGGFFLMIGRRKF